jgi:hypothetical protein
MKALSALLFLSGCLIMIIPAVIVWAWMITLAAKLHVLVGWAVFLGSMYIFWRYEDAIQIPWRLWFRLWRWADDRISGLG